MMKLRTALILGVIALHFTGCASHNTAAKPLPPGVIKEGSLANRKLMVDAAVAATDDLKAKGYFIDPKGVPMNMYVVSMPAGDPGKRMWTERWVLLIKKEEIPITIHFREDGLGAANFVIEGDKDRISRPKP